MMALFIYSLSNSNLKSDRGSTMKNFLTLTIAMSLSLFTAACGESDVDGLAAEACAHMVDDLTTAITAGSSEAEATDTSPSDWLHKRVDLTLADDGNGGFWGFVTYEATEETEYMFYTGSEVTLQIDGLDPETTTSVTACTEVTSSMAFDLTRGDHIVFVSSPVQTISLVAEEVRGHHSHSDHEH